MSAPESVARGARSRIQETAQQREQVSRATAAGRPLDAEPDPERKLGRMQEIAAVTRETAGALVDYGTSPDEAGLVGEARRGAERIQGRTTDFVGVAFLDLARAASSAVARVVFDDGRAQGSGFMISERLFLTNNHVMPGPGDAGNLRLQFNYELDPAGQPRPVTLFELAPELFFHTSNEDDLDFTVVAVGRRVAGAASLQSFGHCPLIATKDKHVLGEFVNVVQHPDGDYKQIVLRENQVVSRLARVLHYMADTQPGSSGSPVFNDQWEAIALHHWGEPYTQKPVGGSRPGGNDVNEGIRISAIVKELAEAGTRMSGQQRQLLQRALRVGSRLPPGAVARTLAPAAGDLTAERERPAGRLPAPTPADREPWIEADGRIYWQVPLEISIRMGELQGRPAARANQGRRPAETPSRSEAIRIDPDYLNRSGYDPTFIPGHRIPLPRLSAAQRRAAARKRQVARREDPFELKYEHFSVVMNGKRRLAFFTATNIDGGSWKSVDRDTGEPRESAEAKEHWFQDPRISVDAQSDQDLYDDQRPRRLFDRGHLVRRQDPAWGTDARARRANADTFHFTNCAPQESQFNQQPRFWQGIENYVLDSARAEGERVSVFTGPVLTGDDPQYRHVQVPLAFWKILVRQEDGQLLATGLLADQSDRIQRLPERLREGFDDLSRVREYQVSVVEIERRTGLDFGSLRDNDTWQAGPEAAGALRPLAGFEDLRLDGRQGDRSRRRPAAVPAGESLAPEAT